ncbi:MAG: hypothetical protein M0Z42_03525 [Actinomycetota bacterium]|nr:hypothetical protein [Actinomycetota bacterium]
MTTVRGAAVAGRGVVGLRGLGVRPIQLSEDEGITRDPDTMSAAWLVHAGQLQAHQAELAPSLDEMGAEIWRVLGQASALFGTEDSRDIGFDPGGER